MPDTKQIISFLMIGLAATGVLFCILALALNTWFDYFGVSIGLWKVCVLGRCESADSDQIPGWLYAVRAFAFHGLIWMVITTVAAVLWTFFLKDKIVILYLTTGLSAVSGLCMMIAFAVYANNTPHEYRAGFALCIVAWLLGWAVAGLGGFLLILNRATTSLNLYETAWNGDESLCMMIAFAVYANNTPHEYRAGFALCIVAWLLGWAVAGLGGFLLILNRATTSLNLYETAWNGDESNNTQYRI